MLQKINRSVIPNFHSSLGHKHHLWPVQPTPNNQHVADTQQALVDWTKEV